MKNLVFDSNLILDYWLHRLAEADSRYMTELLSSCAQSQCHGWISSASVVLLEQQYMTQAGTSMKNVRESLADLLQHLRVLSSFGFHVSGALAEEGALAERQMLMAAAELQGETVIVSARNALAGCAAITILNPDAALAWLTADPKKPADFIDLKTQQDHIKPLLERNIQQVLRHGQYVMGSEITTLEATLAEYVGVKHCIANASGTDALLIAMLALGIQADDEVITTPFTFIATGEMIALIGAIPVFVDIDPVTYNIDPALIEAAITPKTKAIMPVSLYGQCADFDAINAIAAKHNLPVIEDAAQSFGATYHGRQSCSLSTIGCTSFFPSKPLGAYGDGGACFTNDEQLAKIMREIRLHGQDRRYHHPRIGINGRLDTLQAAVLLAKWEQFLLEVPRRAQIGGYYSELIEGYNQRAGQLKVTPPTIATYNTSVYAQYTVLVNHREQLQQQLNLQGIANAVHYPVPLHRQPALATDAYALPVADRLSDQVISLPMHPYLTSSEQENIIEGLFASV